MRDHSIFSPVIVFSSMFAVVALAFPKTFLEKPVARTSEPLTSTVSLAGQTLVGDTLYFDFAGKSSPTSRIAKLDLSSNEGTMYLPDDPGDQIASPSFSSDGQLAAIVISSYADRAISQIGILDLGKASYRPVTTSASYKQFPTLSPDGARIIFAQANRKRQSGRTSHSAWDIYEVDVDTGVERRLTSSCLYSVSTPFYLPGNRFVFAGVHPTCGPPSTQAEADAKAGGLPDSEPVVYSGPIGETPCTTVLTRAEFSSHTIAATPSGSLFFIMRTNEMDRIGGNYNYDLFTQEGRAPWRLTNLRSYVQELTVAADGQTLVYGSDKYRIRASSYWLMDVRSGRQRQILFGDPDTYARVTLSRAH